MPARQLTNPGKRGQNARYDIRGLQRGNHEGYTWTDGQYWYDDKGLSDRPDALIAGLTASDELNGREPWDSGVAQAQGGQRQMSRGPQMPSLGMGEMPWFGYEGQAPAENALAGIDLFSQDNAQPGVPAQAQASDPVAQAIAELTGKAKGIDPWAGFGDAQAGSQAFAKAQKRRAEKRGNSKRRRRSGGNRAVY